MYSDAYESNHLSASSKEDDGYINENLTFLFQKSNFKRAEQISEILLVEPLFIEDLLRKMQKNGLLIRENNIINLPKKE